VRGRALLGFGLGAAVPGRRRLWLYAATLAIVSMLLAFGGSVYELYHETPIGSLFRRPIKFLHLWAFGGSLLAALAVTRLEQLRDRSVPATTARRAWTWLVAGLVALHCVALFTSSKVPGARPILAPTAIDRERALFDRLRARLGDDERGGRIHLAAELRLDEALMFKQGTYRGLPVVMDKQPLTPMRTQLFLEKAAGPSWPREGNVTLQRGSHWKLLDLMSTRFYVLKPGSEIDQQLLGLANDPSTDEVRVINESPGIRVYERGAGLWLPRAHVVRTARPVATANDALRLLSEPDFDPWREVLVETQGEWPSAGDRGAAAVGDFHGSARIVIDTPERVEIEADASQPGWLLLTDAWYPGWQARVDGVDAPIHRANAMFRALEIPAGQTRVTFDYAPSSLQVGLVLSLCSGLLFVGLTLAGIARTRDRRQSGSD